MRCLCVSLLPLTAPTSRPNGPPHQQCLIKVCQPGAVVISLHLLHSVFSASKGHAYWLGYYDTGWRGLATSSKTKLKYSVRLSLN